MSENAEYSAAREKQSFIEGRILELGDKLARAEVIDPSSVKSDKVVFGATVTIQDEDGKKSKYQIVGEVEADINQGRISIASPLAKSLLGKRVGDELNVRSPRGDISYEVLNIEYV